VEIFKETKGPTLISEMTKIPLQQKRETQNGRYTKDLIKRRGEKREQKKTDSHAIAIEQEHPCSIRS